MPDRSTHPTVIEYAVAEMFKGKGRSPAVAARNTASRLSGSENLFLGSGVVEINPLILENAIWDRIVDFTLRAASRMKPGFMDYAIDGATMHFKLSPKSKARLAAMIAGLGSK